MKIISSLLNLILPKRCLTCNSPLKKDIGNPICLDCWKNVKFSSGPLCPICGRPFRSEASLSKSPDHICGFCRKMRPYFERHVYIGLYEGILSDAIRLFKYKNRVSLAYPLSYLLCKKIMDIPKIDIIVPIPLHINRLRSREFNQSLLLSDLISQHLNRPVMQGVMAKIKDTRPQADLDRDERRRNNKNAFSVTDRRLIKGKRILLVDDVFTTGSTVNECAKILKRSGAYSVCAVTLAIVNDG